MSQCALVVVITKQKNDMPFAIISLQKLFKRSIDITLYLYRLLTSVTGQVVFLQIKAVLNELQTYIYIAT